MMKLIRTIVERIKHGYKIAENCYLAGGSRDSVVVLLRNKKLQVPLERLRGKPSLVIYAGQVKTWMSPHDNEPLSELDRKFIIHSLVAHFEKHGEIVECQ